MTGIKILIERKHKMLVWLFFASYLCIGISAFRDYGISCDEGWQRQTGIINSQYILKGDRELLTNSERYHGPAFEVFLIAVEAALRLGEDKRAVYLMRHLVTFLLFFSSVIFFYLLNEHMFRSWKLALLGSLFLILSPRIFADSFYNSKDSACLAMAIISAYTLVRYLDKKTLPRAVSHALTCALVIDIRIVGIVIPFFTVIFFIIDLLVIKTKETNTKRIIAGLLIYAFLLVSFTVLFWPVLWAGPLEHFVGAFMQMRRYPYDHMDVLYLGSYVMNTNLPWHYVPSWIFISTPLFYSFCFLLGCLASIKLLIKNPIRFYVSKRSDIIFALWFFFPILMVIVNQSVLHDGWRHMFFVYPGFLILSLAGLRYISESIKRKFQGFGYNVLNGAFISIAAFSLINTAGFMVKHHPYQNVYFNILAGRNMEQVKNTFELDYWGLSYKQALEYILKNDTDKVIKIYIATCPEANAGLILSRDDRDRLVFVGKPAEAKYFLSNYRWRKKKYPYKDEYYSIKIGGTKIMVVYRL